MLRALSHRNYRLFFFGQGVSLIGTWIQQVALGWLVYDITGSKWLLGVVAFAGQIPTFLLSPLAGAVADRADRRRLLLVTQTLAMLLALALGELVLGEVISRPADAGWIVALAALTGTVMAFDIPARQAFVVEMVGGPRELPNAIALNSMLVNGARLVGPAVAGGLIRLVGAGCCFLINGLSFAAVLLALLAMRLAPRPDRLPRRHILREMLEGVTYAWREPYIRLVLTFLAGFSLVGVAPMTLMPAIAKDVLGGDETVLGLLYGSVGAGATCGTFFLARQRHQMGLGTTMAAASAIFGAALVAFSFSLNLYLSMGILAVLGFGQVLQLVAGNTLVQTVVEDDKRGRVMSLYAMSFMGMMPFGSLLAGWAAHSLGAMDKAGGTMDTVYLGGVACLFGALLFTLRLRRLRRRLACGPVLAAPGDLDLGAAVGGAGQPHDSTRRNGPVS